MRSEAFLEGGPALYIDQDTIAAPATAPGEGGIAIIRVSGPRAREMLSRLTTHRGPFEDHRLTHCRALDENGEPLDECMAVMMAAPATYTREDVAEFHLHGGWFASHRLMEALRKLGIRTAEAGEFTRRAFMNGRIDLSRAEAVMDLIRSGSERSARCAVRQLNGGVSSFIRSCQEELTGILAGAEAAMDYPEEIPEEEACADLKERTAALAGRLRAACSRRAAALMENGLDTVLCGAVNAGKSSLLNALCGEERAIVTPIPGTTRDIVTASFSSDGIRVDLRDTAGLRDSADGIEMIGISRARTAREGADLCLVVIDSSAPVDEETEQLLRDTASQDRILVLNKRDLPPCPKTLARFEAQAVGISCVTGEGLDLLREEISRYTRHAGEGELTRMRHITLAEKAADALEEAARLAEDMRGLDLCALELHEALSALGAVTGDMVDEKMMDEIFSRFCVGK